MTREGWSSRGFEAVTRLVADRTGLTFAPRVHRSVEARIRRAMSRRSSADLERYLATLLMDEAAFEDLLTELTIGETYFFREPAQFEYLRTKVIPELMRERGAGCTVRAWSAGCATGEEAYSLAALLLERGAGAGARVLGTDLSTDRLKRAREAVYSPWSLRGVPETLLSRYFRQEGRRYHLTPEVSRAVKFQPLNLAGDSYPSLVSGIWEMDVILCRNVLIYLDACTVAAVAARLISSLHPDGWLFLGASDPPLSDLTPCEVVVTGSGVAYRRPRRRVVQRPRAAPAEETPRAARAALSEPARRPVAVGKKAVEAEAGAAAAYGAYASGDYTRTAQLVTRVLEKDTSDAGLWVLLVRAFANAGRLTEAGRACISGLEHHGTSAELMYLHATLLAAGGRHADAAAAARRTLYLDRRMAVAYLLLGDLLLRLGDRIGARRGLRNAERMLEESAPDEVVPASDGERAGRLLEMARLRLKLTEDAA